MPDPVVNASGAVIPGAGEMPNPSTPSADYNAMLPYWLKVKTVMGGSDAMIKAGVKYLPQFPHEDDGDYRYRLNNAKFTNVFTDIVSNLAAKPFIKEVQLVDKSASKAIKELVEDIDGQGNHLNVFASQVFFRGIGDAIDWILVDKPPVTSPASGRPATIQEEKDQGARPYWVHVPAMRMLAVYSATVMGRETFVHARIHEPVVVREHWKEVSKNRVRVLDRMQLPDGSYAPATWELYEEQKDTQTGKVVWISIGGGPIATGTINIVPFITGRREGASWQFTPVLQDALHLQVKHFQYETNLDMAKEQSCFPMLSGDGVSPVTDESGGTQTIAVGPKVVLFGGVSADGKAAGSWKYVEPSATSLKFLADDIANTEKQIRELGRQPLTANSGNLTVVTTAFAAQKGNSAVQQWAFNLKDALEQALKITVSWLSNDTSQPEVFVFTDFSIDLENDKSSEVLPGMYDKKVISRKAYITEAKRRDWLAPEYDEENDQKQIDKEAEAAAPPDPTNQDVLDALGNPIAPPVDPNNPNRPPLPPGPRPIPPRVPPVAA